MGEQQTQPVMPAANGNGKRYLNTIAAAVITALALLVPVAVWACDRFGSCEARISVLENNFGHIQKSLERIERKLDERRQ